MSILLLLVAIVIVTFYGFCYGLMPVPLPSFLPPLLLLSILYVLGFTAATLEPRGSAMNGRAVLFLAVIALYGGRRLWSRIGERSNPE